MKKKNKIFSSLLAAGLGVTAIAASLPMLTSCSSGSGTAVTTVTYNVTTTQKTYTNARGEVRTKEIKQFPAKTNPNALDKINNFKDTLSKEQLQNDFNRALTDFYKIYEVDNGNTEMEIETITVKSRESDGSFLLDVGYELETDKYSIQPRDRDDNEQIKHDIVPWTPNLVPMDYEDIMNVTQKLRGYKDKDNKNNIDLEDLKEIFLGENDRDDDYDFDDNDDDDIGIFDRVGAIGKTEDHQSSIIAYSLRVSDIFDKLHPNAYTIRSRASGDEVNKNTEFMIPSVSLNNDGESGSVVLVPGEKPSFTFNSILPSDQFKQIFVTNTKTSLDFTNDADLLNLVFGKATPEWKTSVATVDVDKVNGTLTVNYNDANTPSEQVIIASQYTAPSASANPKA